MVKFHTTIPTILTTKQIMSRQNQVMDIEIIDIEIIDERLRRYELEEDKPDITKEELIQRHIDDWRYIDENYTAFCT